MIFGAGDTDSQAVQLFDRFCLGGIGEEILALQHGTIICNDIFDQSSDIGAGLVGDISLCIDLAQLHLQNIVDSVGGGFFVIDLTAGSG